MLSDRVLCVPSPTDVKDIKLVVNYDMPKTAEDYVHRIGHIMANEYQSSSDFEVAAAALHRASVSQRSLAREISRLPQAPAFQALEIQQQLTAIQTELRASSYNMLAMLANQRVTEPNQQLRSLRNVTTNQPIPHFPGDLVAVKRIISVNTFRHFMNELGLDMPNEWPIATARQDFRRAIGYNPV